jgi:hypothetical protein
VPLERNVTVATSLIGLRQADASGHGTTQDAATRADSEAFRVMSGMGLRTRGGPSVRLA